MTNEELTLKTIDELRHLLMNKWHFSRNDQDQLTALLEQLCQRIKDKYAERTSAC